MQTQFEIESTERALVQLERIAEALERIANALEGKDKSAKE